MSKLKLNKLVNESITWANRKFGEGLPTLKDYKAEYDKKQEKLASAQQQIVKHPYSTKTFGLKIDKKQYDKTLELLMKKRIDVRG